jgi:hypothetical protein
VQPTPVALPLQKSEESVGTANQPFNTSFLGIALSSLLLTVSGCRQQSISINGHDVGATIGKITNLPAIGSFIPIPDPFSAERAYFQSRGVITLDLIGDVFTSAESLQLTNETTNSQLVDAPLASINLVGSGSEAQPTYPTDPVVLLNGGSDVLIRFYPLDPGMTGKFSYGSNALALHVNEEADVKVATHAVVLKDYPFQTMGLSAFATPTQRLGGLQIQVDYLAGPLAPSTKSTLTVGSVGLANW